MRILKFTLIGIIISFLGSCASGYKMMSPDYLQYNSGKEDSGVKFEYKYDLLKKKYAKKEDKKGIRIVAVKITNNSGRDLSFGKDFSINYQNGNPINLVENEYAFKTLKQSTASYLLYLLLLPVNLQTTRTTNGFEQTENIFPIGLILGPGIAGGNMIAAGSANKKFKEELTQYDLSDKLIKDGETKVGLIAIQTNSYDALSLKMK
jgi:hypothetical protein